jgi:hypothetical protein
LKKVLSPPAPSCFPTPPSQKRFCTERRFLFSSKDFTKVLKLCKSSTLVTVTKQQESRSRNSACHSFFLTKDY